MRKYLPSLASFATLLITSGKALATDLNAFDSVNLCPPGAACASTTTSADTVISNVITFLFVLAAVLAVIFLIWGGIKYITASGDKTKVTAARQTIVGAIIGIVIAFSALFIINFVITFLFGPGHTLKNVVIPTIFK